VEENEGSMVVVNSFRIHRHEKYFFWKIGGGGREGMNEENRPVLLSKTLKTRRIKFFSILIFNVNIWYVSFYKF
jgi:hypothetical protein